jgi:hypothetical protein
MNLSLGSIPINLPVLLESRMLVQANSGAGKSWTLRRILEQTASGVQQLVLDPEGEFASLREKFDYIVCAPHGADAVATPQTAAALARALWESGTSAILDIYELKAHERILFTRRFLEALINAPKSIWHPTLVAIDEIQMFAPQVGSAESLAAVIDLASRGRKRGLALVGATQRLSKLHKDVAAELLNKVIMRTGLDVDVARAADEIGLAKAGASQILRSLEPGEAFVFGPALTTAVERTRIGPVVTSHPKTGQRGMVAPPPASEAVLAKLSKLEGLQREAEQEVRTLEGLQREVTELRRKLTLAEKAQHGVPETDVQRRIREAVVAARAVSTAVTGPGFSKALVAGVETIAAGLQAVQAELAGAPVEIVPRARTIVLARKKVMSGSPAPHSGNRPIKVPVLGPLSAGVTAPQQRILDALAWWSAAGVEAPTRHQVAFVAGYTVNGHFNNQCGDLRSSGRIDYPGGGTLSLQESGRAAANAPEAKPTREDLVRRVLGVLKGEPMRRVFQALVDAGEPLSREDLAANCGYTVNGHFNNMCGALNGIGVAEYPTKGMVGLAGIFKGLR